jgi:2-methylcitrate dehydratase PrpD
MAPAGDVTPVGCDFKTTAAMAAFTNALNAQTHDYNDGLNNSGMLGGAYHPGRTVVSTALAVGQQVHASGKDILLAVVLGIEAAARMRNPAHGSLIADCYSSAVTAAKLMGANAGQFRSACALAADLCVAQKSKTIPGYSTSVTNGKGASAFMNALKYAFLNRSSIEAAELAMLGYEGNTLNDNQAISSRYYTTGLGKHYQCMDMYFKPWPCCRKTHGAIGAALALKNECGVKAEDIEAIRIYQQSTGMYVNSPFTAESDICYHGQFSLQYTVSCVFLDGTVDLRHYRWPDRRIPQKYVDFSKKITVVADNGLDGHNAISPNHAIVEVTLNDGKVLSMYCKYPLGSEPNQMTDAQFEQKLRNCAEDMTAQQQDKLVNWIMTLDTLEAM